MNNSTATGNFKQRRRCGSAVDDDFSVLSSTSLKSNCNSVNLESCSADDLVNWLNDFSELHSDDEFSYNEQESEKITSSASFRGCAGRHRKKSASKGAPKRPLSAYNIFFQLARRSVVEENGGKVTFENLGKIVGKRWKSMNPEERKIYEGKAMDEMKRYHEEMLTWRNKRRIQRKGLSDLQTTEGPTEGQDSDVNGSQEHDHSHSQTKRKSTPSITSSPTARIVKPSTIKSSLHILGASACSQDVAFLQKSKQVSQLGDSSKQPAIISLPYRSKHTEVPNQAYRYQQMRLAPLPTNRTIPSEHFFAPAPPSECCVVNHRSNVNLPYQDQEITFDDNRGHKQAFRVQYKCYRMLQSQLDEYLAQVSRGSYAGNRA